MTDWTELKTGKEVFDRAAEGWEIETDDIGDGSWKPWNGKSWSTFWKFRGHPKQPQEVIYECFDVDGRLEWIHPTRSVLRDWIRHPERDITVKVQP